MNTSLYSYVRHSIISQHKEGAVDSLNALPPIMREHKTVLQNTLYQLLGGHLSKRLLEVMACDIPAKDSPLRYHHCYHELDVVLNVLRFSGYFELNTERTCYDYAAEASKYDALLLLVAAMFHDYQHTQSKLPDIVNIANAISLFVPAIRSDVEVLYIDTLNTEEESVLLSHVMCWYKPDHIKDLADLSCDIIKLIEGTKYPYPVEESVPKLVETLRMCDVGTSLLPGWFDSIYGGLFFEQTACGKIGNSDHGFAKFCDNQVKFVASYPYNYELTNEHRVVWEHAYQNAVLVKTLVEEWISLQ